jgi:hypothetical protein
LSTANSQPPTVVFVKIPFIICAHLWMSTANSQPPTVIFVKIPYNLCPSVDIWRA